MLSLNTKYEYLKKYIQTKYNDIFKFVYIGNYEELNKYYEEVKIKIEEIDENKNLIFTYNYNILKDIIIKIFELKNPMINLDILHSFLNN